MTKSSKKTVRRMLGTFLAILLILSVFTPSVYAASEFINDWAVNPKTGELSLYTGTSTNLVIPEKIGNVKVTCLGNGVFSNNDTLKSITIPGTITEIPGYAFEACSSLTTVNLPKTMKKIEFGAFMKCTSLKNITLPQGLKTIGDGAFSGCGSLTKINIPISVTSIGEAAFLSAGLTSFTLPDNFDTIPKSLLSDTKITTFIIPNKIKTIGESAFSNCSKLTTLNVPSCITTIDEGAFANSPLLTVYGSNGSIAQMECMVEGVRFVDTAAPKTPAANLILKDPIETPANKAAPTANATPSKIKLAYKNVVVETEGYNVNGKYYYRLTDLNAVIKNSKRGFDPGSLDNDFMNGIQLDFGNGGFGYQDSPAPKPFISKNFGKPAQATRVYPAIYKNDIDVSGMICVYSINGEYFYNIEDVMEIVNIGVFLNEKTGVMNIDPSYEFEPFDSPVYAPVPKGDAVYTKIQKGLYDAYLKKQEPVYATVTVDDNAFFYIPRGVNYNKNFTIYLGNNSKFVVRGSWEPEYPTRRLFPKTKTTENAELIQGYNPVEIDQRYEKSSNVVIATTGENNYRESRSTMQFTSTGVSYDRVSDGVQHIFFNYTRNKFDNYTCVYVYFNVVGGESYGYFYSNTKYSIDLTEQLATVVAKNVGKKAVVDKIMVRNTNGKYYLPPITIPVDWKISTSGTAPSVPNTVDFLQDTFSGESNVLSFTGLEKNSFIAKYTAADSWRSDKSGAVYAVVSPGNKYKTQRPNQLIMGETANVALYTGIKSGAGKDSYSFVVSPFSKNMNFALDTH